MKTSLLSILSLFFIGTLSAQTLTFSVNAVSGAYFVDSKGYSLSTTIGEMAMVESFQNAIGSQNYWLTQGFQQADPEEMSGVNDLSTGDWNVYPNPNAGNFYLQTPSTISEVRELLLINALGQIITPVYTNTNGLIHIRTKSLAAGVYFLQVKATTNNGQSTLYTTPVQLFN
jgi:hypothetical protein